MGRGWRSQHELVMWAVKEVPKYPANWSAVGNVMQVSRSGNTHHTTEKPVALIEQLLENTPFAETIFDPFIGSGTTLLAAERLGRTCYGLELDPGYCDVIVQRWEEYTGQKATRRTHGAT